VPLGQLGYYLGSKACSEILVQSYASEFKVGIIRPFFIYGPGQKRSMLIPRLYDSIKEGRPITLQGQEGIRINPVHVEDAASAVIAMIDLVDSAIFNIAGPEVLSIRQICEGMGRHLNRAPVFNIIDSSGNDLVADTTEMERELVKPKLRLLHELQDVAL
jgi:nucleoside-diphosphate-sugar epimerase